MSSCPMQLHTVSRCQLVLQKPPHAGPYPPSAMQEHSPHTGMQAQDACSAVMAADLLHST